MKRWILNLLGRFLGYGSCAECGDSYYWKPWQALDYTEGENTSGMFPVCKECLLALSAVHIGIHCYQLWLKWGESPATYPGTVLWRSIREAKGGILREFITEVQLETLRRPCELKE